MVGLPEIHGWGMPLRNYRHLDTKAHSTRCGGSIGWTVVEMHLRLGVVAQTEGVQALDHLVVPLLDRKEECVRGRAPVRVQKAIGDPRELLFPLRQAPEGILPIGTVEGLPVVADAQHDVQRLGEANRPLPEQVGEEPLVQSFEHAGISPGNGVWATFGRGVAVYIAREAPRSIQTVPAAGSGSLTRSSQTRDCICI